MCFPGVTNNNNRLGRVKEQPACCTHSYDDDHRDHLEDSAREDGGSLSHLVLRLPFWPKQPLHKHSGHGGSHPHLRGVGDHYYSLRYL